MCDANPVYMASASEAMDLAAALGPGLARGLVADQILTNMVDLEGMVAMMVMVVVVVVVVVMTALIRQTMAVVVMEVVVTALMALLRVAVLVVAVVPAAYILFQLLVMFQPPLAAAMITVAPNQAVPARAEPNTPVVMWAKVLGTQMQAQAEATMRMGRIMIMEVMG